MHNIRICIAISTCSNIAICDNEILMCILYSLIMINYYMHSSVCAITCVIKTACKQPQKIS